MKDTIRWGIMGTGRIAHSFAKALVFTGDAEIAAVASRGGMNGVSGKKFAEEFNIPRVCSYEELCKSEDIDVIYIATPTACHYENVKMCFEHNKNVLCEKSVTENYRTLSELISIAREKELFFMEAMWMKFMPSFRQALKWYKDGRIGNIRVIKADFSNVTPFDPEDRLFKKELGASSLLDLGIYPISFFTAFLGNVPENIRGSLYIGKNGADLDGQVTLEYKNGFASTFFGYDAENDNNAVIIGDKGRIVLGDWFFFTDNVTLFDEKSEVVEKRSFLTLCNGYEYEIAEVHDCLRYGMTESKLLPLKDTAANMRIMEQVMTPADSFE